MDIVGRSARGEDIALGVGFPSALANEVMPPVVSLFAQVNPGVELLTADLPTAELIAQLRQGTLDASVSRPPSIGDLVAEMSGSEGVVIALPENQPPRQENDG